MREWNLGKQDPLHLTIAADGAIVPITYINDQIWELSLAGGEPAALALYTTYGLRARSMRLFPSFQNQDFDLTDPQSFYRIPKVSRLFPNFIELHYAPFAGIEVIQEIWAVTSQVIAGRFTFENQGTLSNPFNFEWIGILNPLGENGRSLTSTPIGINHVLAGETEDLQMVCFMTGGPSSGSGPMPGLVLDFDLPPGDSRQITWGLASLGSTQDSYELARSTTAREWDAETARIELLEASRNLEISTRDPDLDAALACSQKIAAGLVLSPGGALPNPSFVLARTPNQGYSLRGNGSDYNHLWNGQTALDAWYLCGTLLPGMEQFAAGLIDNFLSTQREKGFIDWKPGVGGQHSRRLAQPLLVSLALQVYEVTEDLAWLEKAYPGLFAFVQAWFDTRRDADQDGFPEWEHPYQIGLDEIPLYNPWQKGSQGVDPQTIESPALAAMLYRECLALVQMAALVNREEDCPWLTETANSLREKVESLWDASACIYRYRDTITHETPHKLELLAIEGSGTIPLKQTIEPAQRLLVSMKTKDEHTRLAHVIIHGKTLQGPASEDIPPRQIHWLHGEGRYTTSNHFVRVDEIIVRNLQPDDLCKINTIDFTTIDLSLLLPLWAGIPNRERAAEMVEKLMPGFMRPYGLAVCPLDLSNENDDPTAVINLPWNRMIIEGMLTYGFRSEAVKLFDSLIKPVILNLREKHNVSSSYSAISGKALGERGMLSGIAPVGLFLRVLGLKQISSKKIIVEGLNPFPWPVNVQYRGINIDCTAVFTRIIFPGGQTVSIEDPGLHVVTLP